MAGIIAPSRAKSIGELQRFIMDWELRVAEHEARHDEYVEDSVKVAALKRAMATEMAERYIESPNTYLELRDCVAENVVEKMIQQRHGQWKKLSQHMKEDQGSRPEKRRHQEGKRSERVDSDRRRIFGHWFATTPQARDTQRDCARPLQTTPPMLSTRKATRMRSRRRRVMCAGFSGNANSTVQATKTMTSWEWDWKSTEHSQWERLAAVVGPGAAEIVLSADVCGHVRTQRNSQV